MKTISTIVFVLFCTSGLWPSNVLLAQSLEQPVPISAPIPPYPPMARARRISGAVLVDVQVNSEGKVTDAVVLMGGEYLRDAAKSSALLWRFKPLGSVSNYSLRLTFIFHEFSYKPPDKKPDFRSPYQIEILYPDVTADCFNDCP